MMFRLIHENCSGCGICHFMGGIASLLRRFVELL